MREYTQTDLDVAYIIGEGKIEKKIKAIKDFMKPFEVHLAEGLPLSREISDQVWARLLAVKNMLEFQKMFERYSSYYLMHKNDTVFPEDWEVIEYFIENYIDIMNLALKGQHHKYLPLLDRSRDRIDL